MMIALICEEEERSAGAGNGFHFDAEGWDEADCWTSDRAAPRSERALLASKRRMTGREKLASLSRYSRRPSQSVSRPGPRRRRSAFRKLVV